METKHGICLLMFASFSLLGEAKYPIAALVHEDTLSQWLVGPIQLCCQPHLDMMAKLFGAIG